MKIRAIIALLLPVPLALGVLRAACHAQDEVRSRRSGEPRQDGVDRLVLKDGRVLTGRIVDGGGATIRFAVAGEDERKIDRTTVRVVHAHGSEPGIYGLEPPTNAGVAARPPSTYIRHVRGDASKQEPGTLSTGVSRWFHPDTKTTLFLVGAVHIAEQPYFDRLQQILDSTDVCLFEGVKKGGAEVSEEELASLSALGKLQLAMKDALGLAFQKHAMHYDRPFWKNADVDWPTLQAHMKENHASLPTDNPLVRGLLGIVAGLISGAKPDRRTADLMRARLAPILAQADQILANQMKDLGSSIIVFRNGRALEILQAEVAAGPKGRWLSLFYGAGHLPDVTQRLEKAGWKFQGADWVTAWRFTAL